MVYRLRNLNNNKNNNPYSPCQAPRSGVFRSLIFLNLLNIQRDQGSYPNWYLEKKDFRSVTWSTCQRLNSAHKALAHPNFLQCLECLPQSFIQLVFIEYSSGAGSWSGDLVRPGPAFIERIFRCRTKTMPVVFNATGPKGHFVTQII